MSADLELARAYVTTANAKDVDGCIAFFTDDAVMDSPMGPKKGKAEIRSTLNFLLRMAGDPIPAPGLVDGVPTTSFHTPGGKARMTFHFRGDQIEHLRVAVGG